MQLYWHFGKLQKHKHCMQVYCIIALKLLSSVACVSYLKLRSARTSHPDSNCRSNLLAVLRKKSACEILRYPLSGPDPEKTNTNLKIPSMKPITLYWRSMSFRLYDSMRVVI